MAIIKIKADILHPCLMPLHRSNVSDKYPLFFIQVFGDEYSLYPSYKGITKISNLTNTVSSRAYDLSKIGT